MSKLTLLVLTVLVIAIIPSQPYAISRRLAKKLLLRKKSITEGCKYDESVKHKDMDADCLNDLFNFYHDFKTNWSSCKSFDYDTKKYSNLTSCNLHWNKCKNMQKDTACCKSVHCVYYVKFQTDLDP